MPPKSQPPSLALFDMDDVLFEFSRPARLANLSALTGLPPDRIHDLVWASGFDDDNDRGMFSPQEYLALLAEKLGAPLSGEAFIGARTAAMRPDEGVWRLIERVRPGVELALLTNNGPLLKAALPRAFPQVAAAFGERVYFSSEFKVMKPEVEVFRRVLEVLGFEPGETLFIDDSAEYIEGARKAGLRVHHFQGAEGLKEALVEQGLI